MMVANTKPTPPAIANGTQSSTGRFRSVTFSTKNATATTTKVAAQHQTKAVKNRWNRNRRQTRPIGLSSSLTATRSLESMWTLDQCSDKRLS